MGFNSAFKGLKSDTNNGYFTRRPVHNFDNISLNFVRMRKVSDKVCTENKKHTFYVQQLLFENRVVYEITWKKHCRDEQATDDNMAHARCMLDT